VNGPGSGGPVHHPQPQAAVSQVVDNGPVHSSTSTGPLPTVPEAGLPAARPARAAGLRAARADLRPALLTVLALTVSGLLAGGLWLWLAPRAV
jgi:hypothetical protein